MSRYSLTYANGNGGTYAYFFCLGRAQGNGCDQPYLGLDGVEEQVADFYRSHRIDSELGELLRREFRHELHAGRERLEKEAQQQGQRLERLRDQRRKLLSLHYDDAIAMELFEEEQTRIGSEMAKAQQIISEAAEEFAAVEEGFDRVFDIMEDFERIYRLSDDAGKRRLNRALFSRIYVDDVRAPIAELADPPGPDKLKPYYAAVVENSTLPLTAAERTALKAFRTAKNPALISSGPGSNVAILVEVTGLEP